MTSPASLTSFGKYKATDIAKSSAAVWASSPLGAIDPTTCMTGELGLRLAFMPSL